MKIDKLDEKGFVFLDDANKPYLAKMWGSEAWLFYWHPDNNWVSLRPISQFEIFQFSEKRLTDEQAEMYHNYGKMTKPKLKRMFKKITGNELADEQAEQALRKKGE